MEERKHEAQPRTLVLHYDKRRYDGGSEIEVIEHLESLKALQLQEANRLAYSEALARYESGQSEKPTPVQESPKSNIRAKQVLETLITGPFEVSVGIVGIMTTGLAIYTFNQVKNTEMLQQSKSVLKECVKTLGLGVVHSVTGPFKALKIAVVGI